MAESKINRKEIVEVESRLFSAQRTGDVNMLDQLLHENLIAVSPTGQIVNKEMDLDTHRAKTMVIEEASTEIDEIKISGDTALSVVTMTAKGKVSGTPIAGKFRYFRVWQRFDGALKVIGASFIQLPV